MSYNSQINQSVVQVELDSVFYPEFNIQEHPGYANAMTSEVFKQDTADHSNVIREIFGGAGAWELTAEEETLPQGDPRVSQKKTFNVLKYAQRIDIPKEFYDDNMHGAYEGMVRSFAQRARTTRDRNAFAMYRNAFTTELTADNVAWFSNSHTNKAGNTVDNLGAASALSYTNLVTLFTQLGELQGQDGEIDGNVGSTLVVPLALFSEACEITKSTLRAGTANNNMNYFSELFPGLMVYTSPFLGAAAGGSDTAYYLLSRNHSATRYVREDVNTSLVDFEISDNDVYKYKGRFREALGVMSYEGAVASAGA